MNPELVDILRMSNCKLSAGGSTGGGFASGEGSLLGGKIVRRRRIRPLEDKLKILKQKRKRGDFSCKARFPTERLLDYGVEIDETRELSNIIAKSIITAEEGK